MITFTEEHAKLILEASRSQADGTAGTVSTRSLLGISGKVKVGTGFLLRRRVTNPPEPATGRQVFRRAASLFHVFAERQGPAEEFAGTVVKAA